MNKPESDKDVFSIMKKYCNDKGFNFSDAQLNYMAQDCYLFFESKRWAGIKYWPAVVMRWALNNAHKQQNNKQPYKKKGKQKTVKDIILEQEMGQELE